MNRKKRVTKPVVIATKRNVTSTFGQALAALEEFRAMLVDQQPDLPAAAALAFAATRGSHATSPIGNVHATGVGIRSSSATSSATDFVIKVYVFDEGDVQSAAALPLMKQPLQGVDVEVEHLPVQFAFTVARAKRRAAAPNPAQHQARVRPVPGGVEIGPIGGNFVGTLGCFVRRSESGPIFALA